MNYAKLLGALGLCLILPACQGTQHRTELKTLKDSVSYSIALDFGRNLKSQKVDVNPDAFAQALKDLNDSSKPALTEEQARSVMIAFQTQMMASHAERMKTDGEKNKKEGGVFLAENKKKDGVVTLPSGLQYKILKMGNGRKPTVNDNVSVNYRALLYDGTEFDNSYKNGQPAVFPVSKVIPGISEALKMMPVGSKWQIVIPSELAYGERGVGEQIGPNAVLIFEIELLGIQ